MLRTLLALGVVLAASLLGGCATVVSGTTQTIGINTDPQGADMHPGRVAGD